MNRTEKEKIEGKEKTPDGFDVSALLQEEYIVDVPFDLVKGSFVSIAYISREELLAIRKQATRKVLDHKTRAMNDEIDSAKADLLLCRRVVKGWGGFLNGKEPFAFSPANAEILMKKWGRFAKFVNDVCDDLEALQAAEREKDGKK